MFDEYPHPNEHLQKYFSVAVEKYKTRTYEVEEELKITKKILVDVLSTIEKDWDFKYNPFTGTATGIAAFGNSVLNWWNSYKNKEQFLADEPTVKRPVSLEVLRQERRQLALDKLTPEDRKILGIK